MGSPRRNHSAAFKVKVAIAALKSDQALATLAQQIDGTCTESLSGKRSCWSMPPMSTPAGWRNVRGSRI